jgi:hypothetical protein
VIAHFDRLFSLVKNNLSPSTLGIASRVVHQEDAKLDSSSPSTGTAQQLLPTLSARLLNANRNGLEVHGLSETIHELKKLPSETRIEGYIVTSAIGLVVIYIQPDARQGIGVIVPPITAR